MSGFSPSFPSHDPEINILPPGISPSQAPEFSWSTPLALSDIQRLCNPTFSSPFAPVTAASRFLQFNDVSYPRKDHDLQELIANLRVLIADANKAVNDVLNVMKLKRESLPRICVADTADSLRLKEVTGPLLDVKWNFEVNDRHSQATKLFSDLFKSLKSKKDPTNAFFYSDSPGVVQMHMHVDGVRNGKITLPDFAAGEVWAELMPPDASDKCACLYETSFKSSFPPSRLWSLEKEIDAWQDFPSKSNLTLLKVAWALKRVKNRDLRRFLLNHLSSYTIGSYRRQVDNILYLIVFCLRSVQRKAAECSLKYGVNQKVYENSSGNRPGSGLETQTVEFSVLPDSANWLSSLLSPLFVPVASKSLVLHCYKHAFKCAIRSYLPLIQSTDPSSDTSSQMGSMAPGMKKIPKDSGNTLCDMDDNGGTVSSLLKPDAINGERKSLSKSDSLKSGKENLEENFEFQIFAHDNCENQQYCFVGEVVLSLSNLAAAVISLEELQDSQKCIKSDHEFFQSPPYHRLHLSNMIVERAEELRATRVNYRPVLEYDGLMWQTQQNQESNRNKTKEEILAEERDYKRRRMSYRGKNVKRTPVQVLRDIINGHMQDIVSSGGIGCFGRRLQEMPPLMESLLTAENAKGRTESLDTKDSGHSEHNGQSQRDYQRRSHGSSTKTYHRSNEFK